MVKRKNTASHLLARFRGLIQAAATLATNIHLPNFAKGGIYQGAGKAVCVPGLNCYSCPGALASCPIGSLQAVLSSSEFTFSCYVLGFLMLFGTVLGRLVCGWLCPFGLFQDLLRSIFAQLSRAGVRIVVGHGHGPSTNVFQEMKEEAEEKYGLCIMTAWTYADDERLKYQNDHAGANETSIVMAVRPELVDFGQVKEDESNLIGIAGRHPVRESSEAFGNEILEYTMKTLISGIEKEYKTIKER